MNKKVDIKVDQMLLGEHNTKWTGLTRKRIFPAIMVIKPDHIDAFTVIDGNTYSFEFDRKLLPTTESDCILDIKLVEISKLGLFNKQYFIEA